jgi:citrate synthase
MPKTETAPIETAPIEKTPAVAAARRDPPGLEGVVVAETVLSLVDGAEGRLVIRGLPLERLAGHRSYEAVVALLLDGFFDDLPEPEALARALGSARSEVFGLLAAADATLLRLPPVEALRALVARIADGDDLTTALRLIAAPAVLTPALLRLRRGLEPLAPDPDLGQAADLLRQLHGRVPGRAQAEALDRYLVTVSDHGLNASTFAARVVASTRAGLTSAFLAALGALKGPLHGGAPGPVLDMLDAVGVPENAPGWLEGSVARGERLMGFGHRIYRVRDPRADTLKAGLEALGAQGAVEPARLRLAEAVETAALDLLRRRKPDRPLQTNVEFYTALLLEALGLPRESFTCVFAAGRSAGWIAHAREQVETGRLLRPQSRYVGPLPRAAA